MKMTPKLAVLGTFIGCFICALMVLSVWLAGGFQGAQASGGDGLDPNIVGIDADIDDDDDTTPDNTATSLGAIDNCVEVGGVGSTFDIDVFLDDVPCVDIAPADTVCDAGSYHNLGGFEYRLVYDNTKLRVNATNHTLLMASYAGQGVADMGDCSLLGSACPDVDGSLYTSVVGLGGEAGGELPGSLGVLSRITLEVVGGDGTSASLTLADLNFGGYEPGVTPWTGEIDTILTGTVAINTICPEDADGDTVLDDGSDLCLGTAPAAPVDVNGCSDAQVDEDGDGYCDPGAPSGGPSGCTGSDLCLGTAPAASVDANGCSDAQVDEDDDGICDPGAPSGGPSACTGSDNCPGDPNPGQENYDGDALGDVCDPDDDDDTVPDGSDTDPLNEYICEDVDTDTCDDCSQTGGPPDTADDGPDYDGDGICDDGDPDDDDDTVPDGSDTDPFDPYVCEDVDSDTCDDCSQTGGPPDPTNDGTDTDSDGICNAGDPDDDNDGLPDGSDPNPLNSDSDGDTVSDGPNDPDGAGPIQAGPDNCVLIANPLQEDEEPDGIGDVCELDVDCSGGGPDGGDALMILQYILGRASLDPTQCPPPPGYLYGPRASAYVAYPGGGTGMDALMILQCILGRNNIVCP